MIGQALAERRVAIVHHLALGGAVPAAALERGMAGAAAEETDQRRREDDQRERCVAQEDREECQRRQSAHDVVLERTPADPRSEEHTSELQSIIRQSSAALRSKKKITTTQR